MWCFFIEVTKKIQKNIFLWIDRFKGALLRRASLFYLDMCCCSVAITRTIKKILWIGRFKSVLQEASSFSYLGIWCLFVVITKNKKMIFPKSIVSKVFYSGGHHFLSRHMMFLHRDYKKRQKIQNRSFQRCFTQTGIIFLPRHTMLLRRDY